MKSVEWKTYRTRFLVKAKQLSSSLTFVDPLGRQHSGRKGDYIVESDGLLRIAPRQIFEDIYVTIGSRETERNIAQNNREDGRNYDRGNSLLMNAEQVATTRRKPAQKIAPLHLSAQPLRRKLPQSSGRPTGSGLGIM